MGLELLKQRLLREEGGRSRLGGERSAATWHSPTCQGFMTACMHAACLLRAGWP